MFGTFAYIISVLLVAWTTLQFNTVSRIITFVGGLISFTFVIYVNYVVLTDACDCEEHHHRTEGNGISANANTSTNTSDSINQIPIPIQN
jgi:hypothetical protein